jgi:hypothetical protein
MKLLTCLGFLFSTIAFGQEVMSQNVQLETGEFEGQDLDRIFAELAPTLRGCVPDLVPQEGSKEIFTGQATLTIRFGNEGRHNLDPVAGDLDRDCVKRKFVEWSLPKPSSRAVPFFAAAIVKWTVRYSVDPNRAKQVRAKAIEEVRGYCAIFTKHAANPSASANAGALAMHDFLRARGMENAPSSNDIRSPDLSAAKLTSYGRAWVEAALSSNLHDLAVLAGADGLGLKDWSWCPSAARAAKMRERAKAGDKTQR